MTQNRPCDLYYENSLVARSVFTSLQLYPHWKARELFCELLTESFCEEPAFYPRILRCRRSSQFFRFKSRDDGLLKPMIMSRQSRDIDASALIHSRATARDELASNRKTSRVTAHNGGQYRRLKPPCQRSLIRRDRRGLVWVTLRGKQLRSIENAAERLAPPSPRDYIPEWKFIPCSWPSWS